MKVPVHCHDDQGHGIPVVVDGKVVGEVKEVGSQEIQWPPDGYVIHYLGARPETEVKPEVKATAGGW